MVNGEATTAPDRRTRQRGGPASHEAGLGAAKLNPFGDLHTMQHLAARLARGLRGVFEPLLRQEVRAFAEPLVVQRFSDYRAERPDRLTAWLPLGMTPASGNALVVLDGRFLLELLDLFFGGTGAAPAVMPAELSPAAEAMTVRIGEAIARPLRAAWEPLARIDFAALRCEPNPAMLGIEADEAVIVTRFGIAAGTAKPVTIDILYPVAAMKPHGATLTGKVLGKVEPDPRWRNELTRSVMGVRFPVRSVLAEPTVPLSMLMNLKPGDMIPITIAPDVPVMIGRDRLGCGTVGTANGHAAIRLTSLAKLDEGQFR